MAESGDEPGLAVQRSTSAVYSIYGDLHWPWNDLGVSSEHLSLRVSNLTVLSAMTWLTLDPIVAQVSVRV